MGLCETYKVSLLLNCNSLVFADVSLGKAIQYSLMDQSSQILEPSGHLTIETCKEELPSITEKLKQPTKRSIGSPVNVPRPKIVS